VLNTQGRTREDRGKTVKAWELEIDSTGFVAGVAASQFSSPARLGAVLAQSAQCQECIAKQYFRYTYGRTETAADRPVIRKMTEDFRRSQYRFKELILSLMLSRKLPEEPFMPHVITNRVRIRAGLCCRASPRPAPGRGGFAAAGLDVQLARHGLRRRAHGPAQAD
jgi:hypothetical protein